MPFVLWIDAAEIRSLVQVTTVTSQAQIGRIVLAAVLFCDDVLNMEGNVDRSLREPAVLATLSGSLSD